MLFSRARGVDLAILSGVAFVRDGRRRSRRTRNATPSKLFASAIAALRPDVERAAFEEPLAKGAFR
jgi:hypothetical protein